MKIVDQSTFWNKKSIVKEFAGYEAPTYWKSFLKKYKKPGTYKILDVGCGGGRNSLLAASLGFDVFACDAHINMVRSARSMLLPYLLTSKKTTERVMRADFADLPYLSKFFDVIIASGVYHNANKFEKFNQGIKETSRVLKNGGCLCLNIFYLGQPDATMRQSKKDSFVVYTDLGLPMVLISKNEIMNILKQNNLFPYGKIHAYTSIVNTGKRYVLRGVFKKAN